MGENGSIFGDGHVNWVANELALGIGFEPGTGIDVYIALGIALVCILD